MARTQVVVRNARRGGVKWFFFKAAVLGLVGYACYNTYVPESMQDKAEDKLCDAIGYEKGTPVMPYLRDKFNELQKSEIFSFTNTATKGHHAPAR